MVLLAGMGQPGASQQGHPQASHARPPTAGEATAPRALRCAALPTAYAPSRHAAAPACSSSRSALVGGRYISSQTHRLNCSTGLRKLQAGHSRRSAGGDAARRRATGPQQCG